MQPAADEDILAPDIIIPRRIGIAVALLLAWVALGAFAITHPSIDELRPFPEAGQILFFALALLPGNLGIVLFAAAVLVWIALLRPQWSDKLLFVAALTISWLPVAGGVDDLSRTIWHHAYSSDWVTADAVGYGTAALVTRGNLRLIFVVILAYLLLGQFVLGFASLVQIAGGLLLAAFVLQIGLFIVERAKLDVLSDAAA